MHPLVEPLIERAQEIFHEYIDEDDLPEDFAEDMRRRLDEDMSSELQYENGRCKITRAQWRAALDEIYELALEFARDHQESELSLDEPEL
ncbi:hypothetical protein D9M68_424240 [compost metagenome]